MISFDSSTFFLGKQYDTCFCAHWIVLNSKSESPFDWKKKSQTERVFKNLFFNLYFEKVKENKNDNKKTNLICSTVLFWWGVNITGVSLMWGRVITINENIIHLHLHFEVMSCIKKRVKKDFAHKNNRNNQVVEKNLKLLSRNVYFKMTP